MLMLIPVAPEDAALELRIAIERRRRSALYGVCPCGAKGSPPAYDYRDVGHVIFRHEDDCPASDESLEPLLLEHLARGGSEILWQPVVLEARR
jgi:hypothetical protein